MSSAGTQQKRRAAATVEPPALTLEQKRAQTVPARRAARFAAAQRKIVRMLDTEPHFTPEQIEALCALLRGEA